MQTNTLASLHNDHKYMLRLCYVLEKELMALLGLNKHSKANIDQLFDTLNYLTDYNDEMHHAIEDFSFDLLKTKVSQPQDLANINITESQHKVLAVLSDLLKQQCELYQKSNEKEQALQKASLLRTANEFKHTQFSHIEFEQNTIYPMLEKHLSEKDWQNIEAFKQHYEQEHADNVYYIQARKRISASHSVSANCL